MKDLKLYIQEALKITKDSKVTNDDPDSMPINVWKNKAKKETYLWFQWWKWLKENGEHTKAELLTAFKLVPTSYSTMFADLNRKGIIIQGTKRGLLKAGDPENWVVKKRL